MGEEAAAETLEAEVVVEVAMEVEGGAEAMAGVGAERVAALGTVA